MKNRISFSNEHKNWSLEKWRNILWTDESKVMLFGSKAHCQYVRRPTRKEFDPKYIIKTIKHSGGKIMVWGCFSYYGVGLIFFN